MSRDLTVAMAAAIADPNVRPLLLFEALYGDTTVRYWTGIGNLDWNSQTWQGVGTLIECSEVDETDDVKAQGITLKVRGVTAGDIEVALAELRGGKSGSIRLALLDDAGAIINAPKVMFRGRLDVAEIDDTDPETPVINLGYEHELVDLERPREWRFTHEHQQQLYPGDTGLRFIAGLQDKELLWGRR